MQWSAHVSKYEKMGQDMSTCLAVFTWRYPHNHSHTHTHNNGAPLSPNHLSFSFIKTVLDLPARFMDTLDARYVQSPFLLASSFTGV